MDLSIHVGTGRISLPVLWFVLKCRSIRPAEASIIYLKLELAASHTNPSAKYMSVLIKLMPLNPSLSMLNVHITAFISAGRSSEAVDAIFSPCSRPTLRMRIPSTASFAEKEPTLRFKPPGRFIPSRFGLYRPGTFIMQHVRCLRMRSTAFPAGLGLAVEAGLRAFRARGGKIRGKISVKCQFAKKYLEFLRKRRMWCSCHVKCEQIEPVGGS